MKSFAELGVKKEIVHALEGIGYVDPLEVQEKIIPLALQKKNLVFTAKTGSGKTLAFTIAFLARIFGHQCRDALWGKGDCRGLSDAQ